MKTLSLLEGGEGALGNFGWIWFRGPNSGVTPLKFSTSLQVYFIRASAIEGIFGARSSLFGRSRSVGFKPCAIAVHAPRSPLFYRAVRMLGRTPEDAPEQAATLEITGPSIQKWPGLQRHDSHPRSVKAHSRHKVPPTTQPHYFK